MKKYSFTKKERLCSRKLIEKLFEEKNSFVIFPFRIIWLAFHRTDKNSPKVKVAFSVSKRNFKRANKRNTIKRKLREAYRLNKHILINNEESDKQIIFILIYIGKDIPEYSFVEKRMCKMLSKLKDESIKLISDFAPKKSKP